MLLPFFALAQAAQGAAPAWDRRNRPQHRYRPAGRRRDDRRQDRPAHPADFQRHFLGDHLLQNLGVPARRAADRDLPRRLPQERQVLRSAGRLPDLVGQSAGRDLPVRLCRAEHPAAHRSRGCRPSRPPLRRVQRSKSLDAVDRALLRATAVELNKLEDRVPFLATTASITPFIGLFGTVWGIVIAFQGIAVGRQHQPRRRRPTDRRGADRHRGGALRGDTGGVFLQPLHQQGEEVRDRDGRLLAGVPEHLGAELHVMPVRRTR